MLRPHRGGNGSVPGAGIFTMFEFCHTEAARRARAGAERYDKQAARARGERGAIADAGVVFH